MQRYIVVGRCQVSRASQGSSSMTILGPGLWKPRTIVLLLVGNTELKASRGFVFIGLSCMDYGDRPQTLSNTSLRRIKHKSDSHRLFCWRLDFKPERFHEAVSIIRRIGGRDELIIYRGMIAFPVGQMELRARCSFGTLYLYSSTYPTFVALDSLSTV